MNEKEWRKAVDEHLLRDLIEDLQDRVKELDLVLRGERGRGGLIAEYERHDEKLTRLYAVIFQDPTGQKGVLHDVDILMGRRSDSLESKKLRWQSWTAILVAIIGATALLTINWDKVKALVPKYHPSPLEAQIDRAKRPRGKKIVRYRKIQGPIETPTPDPVLPSESGN